MKFMLGIFSLLSNSQGRHSEHTHTGGVSPRNFHATQKYHFSFTATQKISAHFIHINLYVNMKYPETMQIEVRIASSEPIEISVKRCLVSKIS